MSSTFGFIRSQARNLSMHQHCISPILYQAEIVINDLEVLLELIRLGLQIPVSISFTSHSARWDQVFQAAR